MAGSPLPLDVCLLRADIHLADLRVDEGPVDLAVGLRIEAEFTGELDDLEIQLQPFHAEGCTFGAEFAGEQDDLAVQLLLLLHGKGCTFNADFDGGTG